ncbi:ATP-binding cassette domain-containing protein [Novosphingobium sp. Gsoil 351]|uniref:ATP-binding cassette domain-containing protein n=1 Tax=Novosphingobium sp. Gsoil 351 TaxID=2675225 RepID=UPI0012B4AF5B|nr:ATP-binding cassette domain-containing protein [Novosphingobium sp. Gsoil 351]QGN53214.1 ATP-binding cassette domain-containing protein [Novosphingobium sp. Gsoil 351]
MADAALLQLDGVAKRFASPGRGAPAIDALRGVSLTLQPGRIMGLIGPDAAGKTTLLRICAGLIVPDAGEVFVFGDPVARLDRARIGYMPQSGALYGELSVMQNLTLYAKLRGLSHELWDERIAHLLDVTGLAPFTRRAAGRLSGGMRQKLAMACAVAAAPPLILLDEPSVGVDPLSRREIWQLARDLAGPQTGIVWATSVLDDADQCDEVLVLHEGRRLFFGPPGGLAEFAAGRVWSTPVPPMVRRQVLRAALEQPTTIAGRIDGGEVRLTLRSAADQPPAPGSGAGSAWRERRPRVDDGFAWLLDDASVLKPSAVAAAFAQIEPDPAAPPAIEAVGLGKRFGDFVAVHNVSFAVAPGEVFGLLGPNGAGKSTTFRMLCGLAKPSAGHGRVAGHDLTGASAEVRQALGYMPQRFSLYGDLSVAANLRFVAGAYGLAGAAAREAIDGAVDNLALGAFWKLAAGNLPLGVKQRLALAAAVMHGPRVLFLDEPTSGVDPLVRREFWHHITAIADRGVAVLVTTHFMDEAELCDRLLLISQAEAIAQGTPEELKQQALAVRTAGATLEDAFIALIAAQRERGGAVAA